MHKTLPATKRPHAIGAHDHSPAERGARSTHPGGDHHRGGDRDRRRRARPKRATSSSRSTISYGARRCANLTHGWSACARRPRRRVRERRRPRSERRRSFRLNAWSNGQTEAQICKLKLVKRQDVRSRKARPSRSASSACLIRDHQNRVRAPFPRSLTERSHTCR